MTLKNASTDWNDIEALVKSVLKWEREGFTEGREVELARAVLELFPLENKQRVIDYLNAAPQVVEESPGSRPAVAAPQAESGK